jgi:flagellar protein FlaG
MDIRALTNVAQLSPGATEKAPHIVETLPHAPVAAIASVPLPSLDQVKRAVQDINKALQALSQSVEFSVDEESAHTIVRVVDQNTKEIIRQMPSQETLEIARALDKVQGLLIRQKA